jgi:ATP-binding cassette subfamily F protein 3
LQQALKNYAGTVAMVSHDIEFVRNVAETVWEVSPAGVTKYFGNYDYYLEKSASLNGGNTPVPVSVSPLESDGNMTARDRRRARAQARNAIAGELNKAKKEVEKLEALMDEQSSRKAVLVAKLSSGEKVDFAKLNTELAQLDKEITETETRWEERAMELEALRQENDRINKETF